MRIEKKIKKSTTQFTRTTQSLKFSCYDLYNSETHIYVCQIIFLVIDHLFHEKLHHWLAHWGPIHWDTVTTWVFIHGAELYKLFKTQNMAADDRALTKVPC